MSDVTKEQVLAVLAKVRGPDLEGDIVSRGMVSDVFISDKKVYFSITVPADRATELEPLRMAAERTVAAMQGVNGALVTLTADRRAGTAPAKTAPPPKPQAPAAGHAHPHPPATPGPRQPAPKAGVPGVGAIIAVASGKGGVGKSTTAVNLALGFQANGLKVGILDADIYGPSIPRLLNISGKPQQLEDRKIAPMQNYGLKAMSIGFLVEEGTAMIWRGPMIQSALLQMLREVGWGELDILVIDMPPGTGDVQLTLAQQVPLAGAVIVSTPQDLALIDARKAIAMFGKVEIPILGIIENMSYFLAPDTGTRYDIFGHGGAKSEAERIGVPFLGEIPLTMDIRKRSDAGTPVVVSDPDSASAAVYREIASKAWAEIKGKPLRKAPAIVFE
ncbi:Mrp/NBP35 family ATP-binding protein [Rhizobium sp. CFBP 13726]|uniref:Mrp/NBP35 family ATP-binding protein n=1 Tax=Rhizobium sp. CFBP 13726 TaxID=2775296 RepID=UPI00177AF50D|nr:Mrp/NBP35 family ATP-binding protein [Rhizobium sp. CFBP 13726]MBD8649544.1 Mrp/NBP35 family ATP-binding protein [Rhizobium sp. CFBP 13726]